MTRRDSPCVGEMEPNKEQSLRRGVGVGRRKLCTRLSSSCSDPEPDQELDGQDGGLALLLSPGVQTFMAEHMSATGGPQVFGQNQRNTETIHTLVTRFRQNWFVAMWSLRVTKCG